MVYVRKYQSKKVKSESALNPKKDSITLEEAKERFNQYYNTRSAKKVNDKTDKISRIRSKVGDIRYNKTNPKRVLRPNEPGSARYMLPEGPRTFDMEGVDYFPEGTEYVNIEDPEYGIVKVKLEGIPKLKTGNTYSSHFKTKYNERKTNPNVQGAFEEEQSLVNYYWDKYYKPSSDKGTPLKRPRIAMKKWDYKYKGDHITQSYFLLGKNEIFFEYGGNIYYLDSNMRVYDYNHQFINKLKDMDPAIINELQLQGYIDLSKSGYPKWKESIYSWIIFYKYTDNNGKEVNIKLNMDDMKVRDVNTNEILDDWNVYLNKHNLDYKQIYPYKMIKNSVISEPTQVERADQVITEEDIFKPLTLKIEKEPKSKEEEIKVTDIQPAITTKEEEIQISDIQPEITTKEEIQISDIKPEITTKEEINVSDIKPEIATNEVDIDISDIEPETTQKEPETPMIDISDIEPETIQKGPETPMIDISDIEPETTQKEPETPMIDISDIEEEERKNEDEEIALFEDIDEDEENISKIDDLGYSLVRHNGKKYYLDKNNNKYITEDIINKFKYDELYGFDNDYDVLDSINAGIINKETIPYIDSIEDDKIHETITNFVKELEKDKEEKEIVTIPEKELIDVVDSVLKSSSNYEKSIVENIVNDIKEETEDIKNVTPEVLTKIIETNNTNEPVQLLDEINENKSPVISVTTDSIKNALSNNIDEIDEIDIDIDAMEEAIKNELEKYDTDDIPIGDDEKVEIADIVNITEDLKEGLEVPSLKIDIIPSIEDQRYKEFKNLLVNVKPKNIKSSDADRLNDITKYIYDSFHNNVNQVDEVFPTVISIPNMKYVDNEKFKNEMNELIANIQNYKKNYKPDTQEFIKKSINKNDYELTLLKNNKEIGNKIIISRPRYNLLVSRMNKEIDEQTKDKIIWSLYNRYKMLPNIPKEYKDKCKRIMDETTISKEYKSIFYDLEKYFGSTGMC